MPTYEYRCEKCEAEFEVSESISEHGSSKPKCPKCGSMEVSWLPTRVYTVTTKKS